MTDVVQIDVHDDINNNILKDVFEDVQILDNNPSSNNSNDNKVDLVKIKSLSELDPVLFNQMLPLNSDNLNWLKGINLGKLIQNCKHHGDRQMYEKFARLVTPWIERESRADIEDLGLSIHQLAQNRRIEIDSMCMRLDLLEKDAGTRQSI